MTLSGGDSERLVIHIDADAEMRTVSHQKLIESVCEDRRTLNSTSPQLNELPQARAWVVRFHLFARGDCITVLFDPLRFDGGQNVT